MNMNKKGPALRYFAGPIVTIRLSLYFAMGKTPSRAASGTSPVTDGGCAAGKSLNGLNFLRRHGAVHYLPHGHLSVDVKVLESHAA